MTARAAWVAACVALVVSTSAAAAPPEKAAAKPARPKVRATALLTHTKGNRATGSVTFVQNGDQIVVMTDVHNLKPDSEHGMHLHEKGDCSSGDGMSAGGHFNPDNDPHGPQDGPHHAGDMPALKANANGVAQNTFVLHGVTLSEGAHSILGKALIVHADPDDYTSQPAGNSGAPIACGVVR
jgi:superoxide dismutase, Cu-Zn family